MADARQAIAKGRFSDFKAWKEAGWSATTNDEIRMTNEAPNSNIQ